MDGGRTTVGVENQEHMSWVRSRMILDRDLMEWIRHGFTLIAAGFGSFAFLEGLVGGLGEGARQQSTEPSRIFSLAVTAAGVVLIAIAQRHYRKMVAFVNADEFGDQVALTLPDEKREEYLGRAAMVIGVISFAALLFLR